MDIWESILYCWETLEASLPHKFIVDQGWQFQKTFAELATLHDVAVEQSGSEFHNSLGMGERYNAPLRNAYLKLRLEHPDVDGISSLRSPSKP